ncbi:MAG: hypothetical protein KZQ60_13765, partial [Candidatus Thiodiazotropha sp. (ex Lucinoma aequizonata)]|nr:hypothetical protein [Candidatus Thiodiazotropha sp. (ex Lucinoma aequizonata)]
MHYSIMTTAMTLQRLGCALCMSFISPFRSPFRPYNRAYAYRGLTAFAPLSMAVSERGRDLRRHAVQLEKSGPCRRSPDARWRQHSYWMV